MKIKGVVRCLFEQSGTFKNAFKFFNVPAFDYDIADNFKQTDFVVDIFDEIDNFFVKTDSLFHTFSKDDLLLAFFPCTYFETIQQTYFSLNHNNLRGKSAIEKIELARERLRKRNSFHDKLYSLLEIATLKNYRLIIENPASAPNYLITGQNFLPPTFIDKDRTKRGDYFKKPTAYWFINCSPEHALTSSKPAFTKTILKTRSGKKDIDAGIDRSLISPEYAKNFIREFILGMNEKATEQGLLDFSGRV